MKIEILGIELDFGRTPVCLVDKKTCEALISATGCYSIDNQNKFPGIETLASNCNFKEAVLKLAKEKIGIIREVSIRTEVKNHIDWEPKGIKIVLLT